LRRRYRGVTSSREQLHDAAVQVVEEYENEGSPFVLYLRKFDITVLHGQNEVDRYLVENYLLDNLPAGVNLLTVQDADDLPGDRTVFARRAPALLLDDRNWEGVVDVLVWRAELIVSECLMLSAGVRFELDAAVRHGKTDQTVLILPPPDSPFETLDDHELVQGFTRVIWGDEFNTADPFESFVLTDLLERTAQIASLDRDERLRHRTDPERLIRHPITYRGVAEGYFQRAQLVDPSRDDASWWFAFWNYFRALTVLQIRVFGRLAAVEDVAYTLATCYVQLGYLALASESEGETIVFTGNLELAWHCAHSVRALTRYKIAPYDEMAEQLAGVIERVVDVIVELDERVVFRPRVRQIIGGTRSLTNPE